MQILKIIASYLLGITDSYNIFQSEIRSSHSERAFGSQYQLQQERDLLHQGEGGDFTEDSHWGGGYRIMQDSYKV